MLIWCEFFVKLQNMLCVISWNLSIGWVQTSLSTTFTQLANIWLENYTSWHEFINIPVMLCCTLSDDQLSSAAMDLRAISISHSLNCLRIWELYKKLCIYLCILDTVCHKSMSGMGLKWLPGVCWLYQTESKWLFKTRTKVLAENRVSLLYILSVQKHWLMVWRQSSKACTVYGKTSINTVYMKIWNPGKTTFFTVNNV